MEARLILTTCPNRDSALKIARELVSSKLVACVNILPGILSIYRWKGALQEEPEELLIIKTTAAHFDRVSKQIKALHPYEVPEIVSLKPDEMGTSYLKWLLEEVAEP